MNTKLRFRNDLAVLSPDTDEAKRIQAALEPLLLADVVEVTMWLTDEGFPRVDIAFDDGRIMSPREYLSIGEAVEQAMGKGELRIMEMTANSVSFYLNRTDLMPGPHIPWAFDGMGARFEDFRNCWLQYLE